MKRSGPLQRKTELKQGDKQLKRTELARSSKPIPQRSAKRERQQAVRRDVVTEVLRRAGHCCQYAHLIPEVPCGYYPPDRPGLEVDELRGGSYRSTEWLDPDRCRAACPAHHDWKTDNKRELLRRLAAYEEQQMQRQEREVADLAAQYGYTVERTPGGKLRLSKPGRRPIFTNVNIGERRAFDNLKAALRREEQS